MKPLLYDAYEHKIDTHKHNPNVSNANHQKKKNSTGKYKEFGIYYFQFSFKFDFF